MRRWLMMITLFVAAWIAPARADDQAHIRAPSGSGAVATPAWSAPVAAPDGELALPIVYTHGRITVRAEAGLDARVTALAAHADHALADAASDLDGLAVPGHVEVRLVRDARDLARAAPRGRGAPEWAAGVAYPDLGVVVVALARGGDPLDLDGTTSHEMAHLALGAALGDRAPHWLHEGFAWQHSPTDFGDSRVTTLVGMTWFGSTIPLDELDRSFPAGELPASRAYAESYELVQFLAERGRWDDQSDHGDRVPFRKFLRNLAHGEDLDLAAKHAFGRPMSSLFDEWESDLKNRYLWVPVELFGLLLWLVAALLLVLAWRRRKRQRKIILDAWARQEAAAHPPASDVLSAFDDMDDPDERDEDDDAPRGPLLN
ncbi:MAG TPA: hypothetical protein VL463_03440 [Kofleriaceae bacterium]|nr:hypothetical protein [Kofleriaceae bacterium]